MEIDNLSSPEALRGVVVSGSNAVSALPNIYDYTTASSLQPII
jgi:hypothetical protein